MTLDLQTCSQARLSRDSRFDGKFFIGVLSTKIYCRTICPVPTVKEKNVRYLPTAAAAAEAGYRPCLRCRPECSPGTPAWLGTSNTVSRALRLIEEGGLEDSGVEGLADRLGVSSRHLRRLFIQHLGASPSAVAKTRRLHFAKKLIDETGLSMIDVANASGFGCVRRFNAVIRKTYKRTPTHIRRLAHQKIVEPEDQYLFHLGFRPPYNWHGILAYLAANAVPGVELVDARGYRRTIVIDGFQGMFEVSLAEGQDAVKVRVQIPDPRFLYRIIERIRGMFDLNADWAAIGYSLRTDPALDSLINAEPGLRVPGCWNGFELTVQAILAQEMKGADSTEILGRIVQSHGEPIRQDGLTHLFPTPETLANADLDGIDLTVGLKSTIHAVAQAVSDRVIDFERVIDPDAFLMRLSEVPGITSKTGQYVSMRALGNPDAFATDEDFIRILGLRTSCELEARAEAWRPWRSYASIYLRNGTRNEMSVITAGRF